MSDVRAAAERLRGVVQSIDPTSPFGLISETYRDLKLLLDTMEWLLTLNSATGHSIVLHCDQPDFDAIRQAMKRRQSLCSIPDGCGNLAGRLVAEICRGWTEMLDATAGQERDE